MGWRRPRPFASRSCLCGRKSTGPPLTIGLRSLCKETGNNKGFGSVLSSMIDPKPLPSRDALTQEQFYELLRRLHGNPDLAAQKYEELHFKLVKFFQWSSCSCAEDLADETLTRTARKLYDRGQEVLDIESYVWGIAKRIRQEGR